MKKYSKKALCILLSLMMLSGTALPQLLTVANAAPLGGIDLGGITDSITWPWEDKNSSELTPPEDDTTVPVETLPDTYDCGCDETCPCAGLCDSSCSDCGIDCTCNPTSAISMEFVPVNPITVYKSINEEGNKFEIRFTENDKLIVKNADSTDEYLYVQGLYDGDFVNAENKSIYLNANLPASTPVGTATVTAFAYINGQKATCSIPVTVAECPVESISAEYKYTLYDGYSCDIGRLYSGYDTLTYDYVLCTVNYKDGKSQIYNLNELKNHFKAKANFEIECKALGINEGTITMGKLTGKFTVNVAKIPEVKTKPECIALATDYYCFAGEKTEIQLLNIASKGYKPFYDALNLPEGFTLSKDGKLSFTLDKKSAGKTYPLSFELRWENSYVFYHFNFTIHAVDKKDAVKLPSTTKALTYHKEIKVTATAENPVWYKIKAASSMIAVDSVGSGRNDKAVTVYNKDGIALDRKSATGDGPWIGYTRYSVVRGEYYYVKVTDNVTLYAALEPWIPSWKADRNDGSTSSTEKELVKTNEKKTFADDKNKLWNVYKLDCDFSIDMKNGFTYYQLGLMTRYVSPVKIHFTTKNYSSNCEILAFNEYEYDVNGDWYALYFGHIKQETLKDELKENETEYRFDTVYYLTEQIGKLSVEEERYIYLPQGYVFDEDDLHIIKHKKADHTDKAKDGFCDLCGIEIAKDNSKDEPETDVPVTKPETDKPATKPVTPVERPAVSKLGDIDGDNKVSSADARLALRAAVGLEETNADFLKYADLDYDGKITSADARLILRTAVELETVVLIKYMPKTKQEIVDFYKKGVNNVKETKAGYTFKEYTTRDKIKLGNLIVNNKVKKLTQAWDSSESDASERICKQGSEDAIRFIPACTLTDYSKVSAASVADNGENFEITIVMVDEDSPKIQGSLLGSIMPNIISYYEDVETTINEDPEIQKVLSEYSNLHIIYKRPTIKAVMTPEGEFVSIEYSVNVEVLIGNAKISGMTIKDKSMTFNNYCKMYNFEYPVK